MVFIPHYFSMHPRVLFVVAEATGENTFEYIDKLYNFYRNTKSENELNLIFNPRKVHYSYKLGSDDQSEYDRRLQAVRDQNENVIKKLDREISQHEDELKKVENMRLSSIITRENIDHIFSLTVTNEIGEENSFNEIKRNEYFPLIKFLVRNGYIDETYSDYMTYFYENREKWHKNAEENLSNLHKRLELYSEF